MTFPTMLSPWYVVCRISDQTTAGVILLEYWSNDGEGQFAWVSNPHEAMIFMNINSAARVADSDGGIVRVLYNKEGAKEFRPREFENAS